MLGVSFITFGLTESGRDGMEPRQGDAEGRSATLLALDLDRPAVGLDDRLRDGQPQTRSAVPSGSVRPDLRETFEDPWEVLGADAPAVVRDLEDEDVPLSSTADADRVPLVGRVHRVLHQGVERGLQAFAIGPDRSLGRHPNLPGAFRCRA